MKQTRILIAICILAACSKPQIPHIARACQVSVIYDITDSLRCTPLSDPILALYDFDNDREQPATFRFILITDKKLNPVEEIHIDDGKTSEQKNENEEVDYREQLIRSFYDAVRQAIANSQRQYVPVRSLQHSECFTTISNELWLLANGKVSQRTLIVFSDLQENTDVFSCYRAKDRQLLEASPKKVSTLLQKWRPLPPSLQGITIYFMYNPMDREHDTRFLEMMNVYKLLLTERHARIVIQATNKNFQS